MPYPNSNILNIIIPQTSASIDPTSTQAPFVERIISGSRLVLQTDTTGTLIGSSDLNVNSITASNISASGYISASNLYVKTNITDAGTLTVVGASTLAGLTGTTATFSGLVSASAGLTASAIQDAGTLTVVGVTTLAGLTGTTATFSGLVSASAGLTASAIQDAGTLTVVGNSILTTVTASNISASGNISSSNEYIAGTLTVIGNSTLSNVFATNITASNISASGNISASTLRVVSSIVDGGSLTVLGNTTLGDAVGDTTQITGSTSLSGSFSVVGISTFSGLVSASAGLTASAIQDAGTLTVVGNSTLGNTFVTNLTASNISASGQIIASSFTGSLLGTSSWANVSLSSSVDKINDNSTYYVTFVNNTGSSALKADADILSYNPLLNRVIIGNTTGSLFISNDTGTNPNSIALFNANDNQGSIIQIGSPSTNATASLYVGNQSNGFRVLTGQGNNTGVVTELTTNITNATNATSYTDTTAALRVDGGARISKDTWISGSLNVAGDLTIFGSSSVVYISSSTVIINDNIIQLNAFFPYERYAGFEVFDSGSNQRSASLLWDGQNDNWITVDQNNSSSNVIVGPTASFGTNPGSLLANNIPKAYDATGITTSSLSDDATTLRYTGNVISASSITASYGTLTYITGALVTYVTGSFTTLTISTGSAPNAGGIVPQHPTASGMAGQINVDNNFVYVYTNNIWKRVPLSTWSL
jgi:hypothetical protein